jgi:O-antigen ligase
VFGYWLYLVWGLLATFGWAINKDHAWFWIYPQITVGVMMLAAVTLIRTEKQIKTYAWVLVAALGYLAYNFNDFYYTYPGYIIRMVELGFGGVDNNGVASIMVAAVPVAMFMAIQAPKWWAKALAFLAMALMIHVVLFSFSRGGQLGLLIVGGATFIYMVFRLPNKGLTLLIGLVAVVITLRLAGPEVREEFLSIFVDPEQRDASASSRFDTWAAGWASILDQPQGWGPRQFNKVSHQYGLPHNKSIHNLFLQTGADYGVPGLIGLSLFYFVTIWRTFRMSVSETARKMKWPALFGAMVCLSLGGFLVCSTFIGMESVEVGYMIGILGLATVAHVRRVAAAQEEVSLESIPELAEVPPPGDPAERDPGPLPVGAAY